MYLEGQASTLPYAINNRGQMVVAFVTVAQLNGQVGFLKEGNTYTTIDVRGSSLIFVFGLNNGGAITGAFAKTNRAGGFVRTSGGVYTTVLIPGSNGNTIVGGINDREIFAVIGLTRRLSGTPLLVIHSETFGGRFGAPGDAARLQQFESRRAASCNTRPVNRGPDRRDHRDIENRIRPSNASRNCSWLARTCCGPGGPGLPDHVLFLPTPATSASH